MSLRVPENVADVTLNDTTVLAPAGILFIGGAGDLKLSAAQSGTATDGSFVDVVTDGNFEAQHDFATADRWEQFTHSNNRASYKNVSGGNSGYTITRFQINTT